MPTLSNYFIKTLTILLIIGFTACSNSTQVTTPQSALTGVDGNIPVTTASINNDLSGLNFSIDQVIKFRNLELFAISGKLDKSKIEYTDLKTALADGLIEVIETSDVQQLVINNKSDKTIFINGGEIVKGGKQDRVLACDMIIGPGAKNEKVGSFCVESGRWNKRQGEYAGAFGSSSNILSSKKLNLAAKFHKNQQEVWKNVSELQDSLNYNLSKGASGLVDVRSGLSSTSLELTLESEELNKLRDTYKANFDQFTKSTTIGLACAINGKVYSMDVYSDPALFQKLYDKLLNAAIVEAISQLKDDEDKIQSIEQKEILGFLMGEKDAQIDKENINKRTEWESIETENAYSFISTDLQNEQRWIHRNVIVKDKQAE